MMTIGLISDTHIAARNQFWPPQIKEKLKGVDLILHAGDIWIPWVLDELETTAPVLAALGDDDRESDFSDDHRIMERQVLSYENVNIWVQHIKPLYSRLDPSYHAGRAHATGQHSPSQQELGKPPDVVIFGHSHSPGVENFNHTLLVNPGSPTQPYYQTRLGTVGLLFLRSGNVEAKLISLE